MYIMVPVVKVLLILIVQDVQESLLSFLSNP